MLHIQKLHSAEHHSTSLDSGGGCHCFSPGCHSIGATNCMYSGIGGVLKEETGKDEERNNR